MNLLHGIRRVVGKSPVDIELIDSLKVLGSLVDFYLHLHILLHLHYTIVDRINWL